MKKRKKQIPQHLKKIEKKVEKKVEKKRLLVLEGSRGKSVQELQFILTKKGYYQGAIDGQFSAELNTIVKKFQKDNRLVPDGMVGPLTWTVLGKK